MPLRRVSVRGEGVEHLRVGTGIVYRKWVTLPEGTPTPGELVRVEADDYVGCALWEPIGPVALRMVSHWDCPYRTPREALRDRIQAAYRVRERAGLARTGSYRLVNSDGDLLSGLIVDVFGGEIAVLQSSSLAVDRHIEVIAGIIADLTGVGHVYEKSVQRSRRAIGLEPRRRWIIGGKRRTIIEEGGARFIVDVEMGQKTGFYLDQRFNRLELRKYVHEGARVLDLFSYTGGFGIHAALEGARYVLFVEEDPQAVSLLRENLRLNGIRNYGIVNSSVWEVVDRRYEPPFDVVVVDPPAFIQSGDEPSVRRGLRAYFRSYKWATSQGSEEHVAYLSSCSYFLRKDMFVRLIRDVMASIRADYWMLGSLRGAAPDHVHRAAEYLDYLKGAFLYVRKKGGA
ncbi:MAG: class I SAM-dependent rRNA methyltransferase [Desulfurococcales archaeon]|nr:class I SAM-dependent rRNA methyltransferase [Desulfurococcales archaeon]